MTAKNLLSVLVLVSVMIASLAFTFPYGDKEPWTKKQLMQPKELADRLADSAATKPVVISVGPGGLIPTSIEAGETVNPGNLQRLKTIVSELSKDRELVIYCGCCPFNHCPNIRPAFSLLNEMGFTQHKLLNLPLNIKADWVDKGFPVNQ